MQKTCGTVFGPLTQAAPRGPGQPLTNQQSTSTRHIAHNSKWQLCFSFEREAIVVLIFPSERNILLCGLLDNDSESLLSDPNQVFGWGLARCRVGSRPSQRWRMAGVSNFVLARNPCELIGMTSPRLVSDVQWWPGLVFRVFASRPILVVVNIGTGGFW